MPISGYEVIPQHLHRVVQMIKPVWGDAQLPFSVLDLGIGTGQWGFLFRNYLDYAHGRIEPGTQRMTLYGVEGFESYRNAAWGLYDKVIVGDIKDVIALPEIDRKWDFINMIEVLEHFDREDGAALLRWITEHCDSSMFSFHNSEQGDAFGNEFERHRAKWSVRELQSVLPGTQHVCGDDTGSYLLWQRAA